MNLPNKPMNLAGAFNASLRFSIPCTRRLIAAAVFFLAPGYRQPCSLSARRLLAGSLGRLDNFWRAMQVNEFRKDGLGSHRM